jgi:hypothetical protein
VVRANLAPTPAAGLGPWGLAVQEEERGLERALGVDPPHAFVAGDGEGLAPEG